MHGRGQQDRARGDSVCLVVYQARLEDRTDKLNFVPWLWAWLYYLPIERDTVFRVGGVWALSANEIQVSSCGVSPGCKGQGQRGGIEIIFMLEGKVACWVSESLLEVIDCTVYGLGIFGDVGNL